MKSVVIYTSNTCPHCHTAKSYLEENKIEFTEKNVTESAEYRKELMDKKLMGVPAIFIDDELIMGFDKAKIDKLLGL